MAGVRWEGQPAHGIGLEVELWGRRQIQTPGSNLLTCTRGQGKNRGSRRVDTSSCKGLFTYYVSRRRGEGG